jgi:hypothetical protein
MAGAIWDAKIKGIVVTHISQGQQALSECACDAPFSRRKWGHLLNAFRLNFAGFD